MKKKKKSAIGKNINFTFESLFNLRKVREAICKKAFFR